MPDPGRNDERGLRRQGRRPLRPFLSPLLSKFHRERTGSNNEKLVPLGVHFPHGIMHILRAVHMKEREREAILQLGLLPTLPKNSAVLAWDRMTPSRAR